MGCLKPALFEDFAMETRFTVRERIMLVFTLTFLLALLEVAWRAAQDAHRFTEGFFLAILAIVFLSSLTHVVWVYKKSRR